MNRHGQSGFTLIEIMVVVIILGILGAVVVPNIINKPEEARVQRAKTDIQALEQALDRYRMDNSAYPSTDQGLEALVVKPSGSPEARRWNGPYVKKLQKDPWDQDYQYLSPGQNGAIDVFSLGADRAVGGEDFAADIGNWNI